MNYIKLNTNLPNQTNHLICRHDQKKNLKSHLSCKAQSKSNENQKMNQKEKIKKKRIRVKTP